MWVIVGVQKWYGCFSLCIFIACDGCYSHNLINLISTHFHFGKKNSNNNCLDMLFISKSKSGYYTVIPQMTISSLWCRKVTLIETLSLDSLMLLAPLGWAVFIRHEKTVLKGSRGSRWEGYYRLISKYYNSRGVHNFKYMLKKCCFIKNGKRRCKSFQAGMENWIGLFLKNNKL